MTFAMRTPRYMRPRLTWRYILGRLGFKKYKVASFYGWDLGQDEFAVESYGYKDSDGTLHITHLKIRKLKNEKQPNETE